MANCQHCGVEITSLDWRKVTGYERMTRHAGGTNHVALREQADEYVCRRCMSSLQHGIAPGQESLI